MACDPDCQEWIGEMYDDSLKQMWIADTAYADGNAIKAIAALKAQTQSRIGDIQHQAQIACQRNVQAPQSLEKSLNGIADMMAQGKSYKEVHEKVFEVDKAYTAAGYRAFCSCSTK